MHDSIQKIFDSVDVLIEQNKYVEALVVIDNVIAGKVPEINSLENSKIIVASLYIDVVESMLKTNSENCQPISHLNKALGIFNQSGSQNLNTSVFLACNRARVIMLKYDYDYLQNNAVSTNRILTYDTVSSIYYIKDTISEAIRLYWEALTSCPDENERYSIRNNLANALSRVGRRIEALTLLRRNMETKPERWQSYGSYTHALTNLYQSALIADTPSFHMLAIELYQKSELSAPESMKEEIRRNILRHSNRLKLFGFEISDKTREKNHKEEKEDFIKHTEYRKFVLLNDLSLSEHSLHCHCRDAAKDNLKIGKLGGSLHLGKGKSFPLVDSLVNRLISEFTFSRLLYYNYVQGTLIFPEDIDFSTVSNEDTTGYKIEQLRTSYRIAYGILDKIKKGIILLFELEEDNQTYFENFFDGKNKEALGKIQNVHLTALYSLALDFNRDQGSFRNYKKYRNEMEHGLLLLRELNEEVPKEQLSMNEFENLTFDVLKITRTAIFSFVFLVRTATIVEDLD
jgi:tetratricopeptide (TPR) repeat protein